MKKSAIVMLVLLLCAQARGAATKTHVTTNHFESANLTITVKADGNNEISFKITVTPKHRDPLDSLFPDRPRAWLNVKKKGSTAVSCTLDHTKDGKTEVYLFSVDRTLVPDSTFTFSYHTPAVGNFVSHHHILRLEDFPAKTAPNNSVHTISNRADAV